MSTVHLFLTDGFAGDHVVISVDGRKVLDEDGVTTKKLYGLAKELDPVPVDGNTIQLEIQLPRKGLRRAVKISLDRGNQIPISIENGDLTYSVEKHLGFA